MTSHVLNFSTGAAEAVPTDVLCGTTTHKGDVSWHPGHADMDIENVDCDDCQGLYAQVLALAQPFHATENNGAQDGYFTMATELRRVIADHTIRTPEALTELARARRHEHDNDPTPAARGARTACERVMYPLSLDKR